MRRHEPAPMLAAEEQQRGDNTAAVIEERLAAGLPVADHQWSARNAFEAAARHGEQPEGVR